MFILKDILRNTPRKGEILVVFLDDELAEIRNASFRNGELDTNSEDSIIEAKAREQLNPKVQPEV